MVIETTAIRDIIAQHGRLMTSVDALEDSTDLYGAGLTSLATVGVMLAIEDHFNIEFPRNMLGRKTFESIESIAEAVGSLVS